MADRMFRIWLCANGPQRPNLVIKQKSISSRIYIYDLQGCSRGANAERDGKMVQQLLE